MWVVTITNIKQNVVSIALWSFLFEDRMDTAGTRVNKVDYIDAVRKGKGSVHQMNHESCAFHPNLMT